MNRGLKLFVVTCLLSSAVMAGRPACSRPGASVAGFFVADSTPMITESESKLIKQSAVEALQSFQDLLNDIAGDTIAADELQSMIESSYSGKGRREFSDSASVLVQDLEDPMPNAPPSEGRVKDYISDFDLFYVKHPNPAIAFSNYKVSNVKQGNYLYLKIAYDCQFNGKSKRMDGSIPLEHKVAEFRVIRDGRHWYAYIAAVYFYNPADSASFTNGDIPIVPDPAPQGGAVAGTAAAVVAVASDNAGALDTAIVVRHVLTQAEKERIIKENEAIAARRLTDDGDSALARKDYFLALKNYTYAQKIDPDNPYLKARVQNVNQLIEAQNITPEKQYDLYMQQATLARGLHHYDVARVAYDKALAAKPSASDQLRPLINELTAKDLLVNRINLKMDDKDYKGALDVAKGAVKQYPSDPVFLLQRARAYEYLNDHKQARNDYAKAVSLEPGYLDAYLMRGAYYHRLKDYNNALSDYTVVAQTDKENDSVYLLTSAIEVEKNDIDKAIGELSKGIAINPYRFALYEQKGELEYDEQHQPEKAIPDFSAAILKDPSVARAWYYRGLCEVDLNKISEASNDFTQARNLHLDAKLWARAAGLALGFYVKGCDAFKARKADESINMHNAAILIDPTKDFYRLARGESYFFLRQDYATAADNYTQALMLNPRNDTAYQQRGRARYYMQNYALAVADVDSAIILNPQVPERYLYRGEGHFQLKAYDQAIHDFDEVQPRAKAIKRELPDSVNATVNDLRGECYYQTGNYQAALENFKNAVKFSKGTSPSILFDRGKTYFKLNQLKDARADVSAAVAQHAGNAYWDFTLGEIERLSGNYQGAVTHYTAALAADPTSVPPQDPLHQRALCQVKLANYEAALSDLHQIKSQGLDNKYPNYQNELGTVFAKMNKPDSAIVCFGTVLSADSLNAEALYGMGVAAVEQQKKNEALSWFGKAFATGKIHRSALKEDKSLDPVRDDKAFKALVKKYSDQLSK